MHPIIFQFGPLTIYSYGLLVALGFIIATFLVSRQAIKFDIHPDRIISLSLLILISGIIGARVLYILFNIGYYLSNPLEIIMITHGGLVFYGGAISAFLFGLIYVKKAGLSILNTADLVVPYVALGHSIGRIGCLLNGCCFGSLFGIPIQIYSSLALIFIFVLLRFGQDRPHKAGRILYSYFLLYSVKRFIIEFWRAEHTAIFLGITLFQIISIALFCFSLFMLRKK